MDSKIKLQTPHRFPLWPQWLAAAQVFMVALMGGLSAGWPSPYLAKLSRPDSVLTVNEEELSWIASLMDISRPIGSVLGALSIYSMGTKTSTLLSGIPFALSWTCYLIGNSVPLIYASQILSGIALNVFNGSSHLYIGEISDPKIRGALISFMMQGYTLGNLIASVMGKYIDTWVFAAICLVPNLVFLITFFIIPNSPHYLVRCNKENEAAKSIQWYNRNADYVSEVASIKTFMQTNQSSTFCDTLLDLKTPINRKTLFMVNIICSCISLSGMFTVTAYMEIILTRAKVTVVAPSNLVIAGSVISMMTSWLAIYTNDRYGRTIMLTCSSATIAFAMVIFGCNYLLLDLGFDSFYLQLMSIIAVIFLRAAYSIVLTIPPILMSELFAPNLKSVGSCITNIISALLTFSVTRCYSPLVDLLSEKYVFWMYAIPMIIVGAYTMIFIPETKGKSLVEIKALLAKGETSHKSNVV